MLYSNINYESSTISSELKFTGDNNEITKINMLNYELNTNSNKYTISIESQIHDELSTRIPT